MPDIDKQYQEKITEYQELILEPKRLQSSLRNYDLNSYTSRDSDMKRSVVPLAACATALSRMAPDDILDDVHDIFHKSLIKFYRYAKKSKSCSENSWDDISYYSYYVVEYLFKLTQTRMMTDLHAHCIGLCFNCSPGSYCQSFEKSRNSYPHYSKDLNSFINPRKVSISTPSFFFNLFESIVNPEILAIIHLPLEQELTTLVQAAASGVKEKTSIFRLKHLLQPLQKIGELFKPKYIVSYKTLILKLKDYLTSTLDLNQISNQQKNAPYKILAGIETLLQTIQSLKPEELSIPIHFDKNILAPELSPIPRKLLQIELEICLFHLCQRMMQTDSLEKRLAAISQFTQSFCSNFASSSVHGAPVYEHTPQTSCLIHTTGMLPKQFISLLHRTRFIPSIFNPQTHFQILIRSFPILHRLTQLPTFDTLCEHSSAFPATPSLLNGLGKPLITQIWSLCRNRSESEEKTLHEQLVVLFSHCNTNDRIAFYDLIAGWMTGLTFEKGVYVQDGKAPNNPVKLSEAIPLLSELIKYSFEPFDESSVHSGLGLFFSLILDTMTDNDKTPSEFPFPLISCLNSSLVTQTVFDDALSTLQRFISLLSVPLRESLLAASISHIASNHSGTPLLILLESAFLGPSAPYKCSTLIPPSTPPPLPPNAVTSQNLLNNQQNPPSVPSAPGLPTPAKEIEITPFSARDVYFNHLESIHHASSIIFRELQHFHAQHASSDPQPTLVFSHFEYQRHIQVRLRTLDNILRYSSLKSRSRMGPGGVRTAPPPSPTLPPTVSTSETPLAITTEFMDEYWEITVKGALNEQERSAAINLVTILLHNSLKIEMQPCACGVLIPFTHSFLLSLVPQTITATEFGMLRRLKGKLQIIRQEMKDAERMNTERDCACTLPPLQAIESEIEEMMWRIVLSASPASFIHPLYLSTRFDNTTTSVSLLPSVSVAQDALQEILSEMRYQSFPQAFDRFGLNDNEESLQNECEGLQTFNETTKGLINRALDVIATNLTKLTELENGTEEAILSQQRPIENSLYILSSIIHTFNTFNHPILVSTTLTDLAIRVVRHLMSTFTGAAEVVQHNMELAESLLNSFGSMAPNGPLRPITVQATLDQFTIERWKKSQTPKKTEEKPVENSNEKGKEESSPPPEEGKEEKKEGEGTAESEWNATFVMNETDTIQSLRIAIAERFGLFTFLTDSDGPRNTISSKLSPTSLLTHVCILFKAASAVTLQKGYDLITDHTTPLIELVTPAKKDTKKGELGEHGDSGESTLETLYYSVYIPSATQSPNSNNNANSASNNAGPGLLPLPPPVVTTDPLLKSLIVAYPFSVVPQDQTPTAIVAQNTQPIFDALSLSLTTSRLSQHLLCLLPTDLGMKHQFCDCLNKTGDDWMTLFSPHNPHLLLYLIRVCSKIANDCADRDGNASPSMPTDNLSTSTTGLVIPTNWMQLFAESSGLLTICQILFSLEFSNNDNRSPISLQRQILLSIAPLIHSFVARKSKPNQINNRFIPGLISAIEDSPVFVLERNGKQFKGFSAFALRLLEICDWIAHLDIPPESQNITHSSNTGRFLDALKASEEKRKNGAAEMDWSDISLFLTDISEVTDTSAQQTVPPTSISDTFMPAIRCFTKTLFNIYRVNPGVFLPLFQINENRQSALTAYIATLSVHSKSSDLRLDFCAFFTALATQKFETIQNEEWSQEKEKSARDAIAYIRLSILHSILFLMSAFDEVTPSANATSLASVFTRVLKDNANYPAIDTSFDHSLADLHPFPYGSLTLILANLIRTRPTLETLFSTASRPISETDHVLCIHLDMLRELLTITSQPQSGRQTQEPASAMLKDDDQSVEHIRQVQTEIKQVKRILGTGEPNLITFIFHHCLFNASSLQNPESDSSPRSSKSENEDPEALSEFERRRNDPWFPYRTDPINLALALSVTPKFTKVSSTLSSVFTEPQCASDISRRAAYGVLSGLCVDDDENTERVVSLFGRLQKREELRKSTLRTFTHNPISDKKSTVGYCGLENLGTICYMNSFLQQLFMHPSFRSAVLSRMDYDAENERINQDMAKQLEDDDDPIPQEPFAQLASFSESDSVWTQLQYLFSRLQSSQRRAVEMSPFCSRFTDYEGRPVSTHVQMDASEFLVQLFDKIETRCRANHFSNVVNDYFGGHFAQQLICEEGHVSERPEGFQFISLDVKGKKNLTESLKFLCAGCILEGDNACRCETCDAKKAAVKRSVFKTLPDTIIFQLKRFEWNYTTFEQYKVTDEFKFPFGDELLDMEGFVKESFERREAQLSTDHLFERVRTNEGFDEKEGTIYSQRPQTPPSSQNTQPQSSSATEEKSPFLYRLAGIVVHSGSTESGHYYSYIRDRNEPHNWLCFNDASVSLFDVGRIPETCYGGKKMTQRWNSQAKMYYDVEEDISHSAYLLLYDRVYPEITKVAEEDTAVSEQTTDQVGEITDLTEHVQLVPVRKCMDLLEKEIWQDNVEFFHEFHIYNPEYSSFLADLADRTGIQNLARVRVPNDGRVMTMSEMVPVLRDGAMEDLFDQTQLASLFISSWISFLFETYIHQSTKPLFLFWMRTMESICACSTSTSLHIASKLIEQCEHYYPDTQSRLPFLYSVFLFSMQTDTRMAVAKLLYVICRTLLVNGVREEYELREKEALAKAAELAAATTPSPSDTPSSSQPSPPVASPDALGEALNEPNPRVIHDDTDSTDTHIETALFPVPLMPPPNPPNEFGIVDESPVSPFCQSIFTEHLRSGSLSILQSLLAAIINIFPLNQNRSTSLAPLFLLLRDFASLGSFASLLLLSLDFPVRATDFMLASKSPFGVGRAMEDYHAGQDKAHYSTKRKAGTWSHTVNKEGWCALIAAVSTTVSFSLPACQKCKSELKKRKKNREVADTKLFIEFPEDKASLIFETSDHVPVPYEPTSIATPILPSSSFSKQSGPLFFALAAAPARRLTTAVMDPIRNRDLATIVLSNSYAWKEYSAAIITCTVLTGDSVEAFLHIDKEWMSEVTTPQMTQLLNMQFCSILETLKRRAKQAAETDPTITEQNIRLPSAAQAIIKNLAHLAGLESTPQKLSFTILSALAAFSRISTPIRRFIGLNCDEEIIDMLVVPKSWKVREAAGRLIRYLCLLEPTAEEMEARKEMESGNMPIGADGTYNPAHLTDFSSIISTSLFETHLIDQKKAAVDMVKLRYTGAEVGEQRLAYSAFPPFSMVGMQKMARIEGGSRAMDWVGFGREEDKRMKEGAFRDIEMINVQTEREWMRDLSELSGISVTLPAAPPEPPQSRFHYAPERAPESPWTVRGKWIQTAVEDVAGTMDEYNIFAEQNLQGGLFGLQSEFHPSMSFLSRSECEDLAVAKETLWRDWIWTEKVIAGTPMAKETVEQLANESIGELMKVKQNLYFSRHCMLSSSLLTRDPRLSTIVTGQVQFRIDNEIHSRFFDLILDEYRFTNKMATDIQQAKLPPLDEQSAVTFDNVSRNPHKFETLTNMLTWLVQTGGSVESATQVIPTIQQYINYVVSRQIYADWSVMSCLHFYKLMIAKASSESRLRAISTTMANSPHFFSNYKRSVSCPANQEKATPFYFEDELIHAACSVQFEVWKVLIPYRQLEEHQIAELENSEDATNRDRAQEKKKRLTNIPTLGELQTAIMGFISSDYFKWYCQRAFAAPTQFPRTTSILLQLFRFLSLLIPTARAVTITLIHHHEHEWQLPVVISMLAYSFIHIRQMDQFVWNGTLVSQPQNSLSTPNTPFLSFHGQDVQFILPSLVVILFRTMAHSLALPNSKQIAWSNDDPSHVLFFAPLILSACFCQLLNKRGLNEKARVLNEWAGKDLAFILPAFNAPTLSEMRLETQARIELDVRPLIHLCEEGYPPLVRLSALNCLNILCPIVTGLDTLLVDGFISGIEQQNTISSRFTFHDPRTLETLLDRSIPRSAIEPADSTNQCPLTLRKSVHATTLFVPPTLASSAIRISDSEACAVLVADSVSPHMIFPRLSITSPYNPVLSHRMLTASTPELSARLRRDIDNSEIGTKMNYGLAESAFYTLITATNIMMHTQSYREYQNSASLPDQDFPEVGLLQRIFWDVILIALCSALGHSAATEETSIDDIISVGLNTQFDQSFVEEFPLLNIGRFLEGIIPFPKSSFSVISGLLLPATTHSLTIFKHASITHLLSDVHSNFPDPFGAMPYALYLVLFGQLELTPTTDGQTGISQLRIQQPLIDLLRQFLTVESNQVSDTLSWKQIFTTGLNKRADRILERLSAGFNQPQHALSFIRAAIQPFVYLMGLKHELSVNKENLTEVLRHLRESDAESVKDLIGVLETWLDIAA